MEGEGAWSEADQKTVRVRAKAFDPGDQMTCEWFSRRTRKHGGTKRPSPRFLEPVAKPWLDWRKIHIHCPASDCKQSLSGGIDEQTLEIRAAELTTSDVGDAPIPLCQGSCPLLYFSSISQVGGIGR